MDYFEFIFSRNLWEIWSILLLGMARVVPAIALAPFFGAKLLPNSIKVGFGIAVTLLFLPYLAAHSHTTFGFDITFILLMLKEVLIGFFMGFFIAIPFQFVESAGGLIDHQRGASSLQVTNMQTGSQTSPLGTLYNDMMIVIFFSIGGPLIFFDAIFSTYKIVPIDTFLPSDFFSHSTPLWYTTIHVLTDVLRVTVQLSAPSILAMLLSDLFLGIANRMAPQVQISFLLWSLKAFIGIAMVWLAWAFVLKQIESEAHSWIRTFVDLAKSI